MEDDTDETTAFQEENIQQLNAEKTGKGRELAVISLVDKNSARQENVHVKTKRSIYKNLAVVCICFMLLFSALLSLISLQSSINVAEGLGTIGMTFVFIAKVVSSLFLPPMVLSKLGMKWTMCFSLFGFIAYAAASFHATWITIIPTSIFLGVGLSNLWSGQMNFVTELCRRYSSITGQKESDVLSRFFGIFFAVFHTGNLRLILLHLPFVNTYN